MPAKMLLDVIQQPSVTLVILLGSFSTLFWSFSMSMSAIKNDGLRIFLLIALTVVITAVGFHSDIVFPNNENSIIIENFLLNLATEFISALIIIPALYSWWTRDRHWWSGKLAISLIFAVCFACVGLFVLQYTDPIPSTIFQPSAQASRELCINLAVEIFSTLIIFALIAVFASLFAIITSETISNLLLALVDAAVVGLFIIFFFRFGQSVVLLQEDFRNQLITGIWGAIMTTIILGTWVTSHNILMPLAGAIVILIICILIIGIGQFGIGFSVNISAEMLGALIAGVLIEGGWNKKKETNAT